MRSMSVERLLDLAVDHAHEVERHVELQHQHVDHHELADRLRAGDARRAPPAACRPSADGEDQRLAGVEHGERAVGLDAACS